jgi:GcrA cell cycle regulator
MIPQPWTDEQLELLKKLWPKWITKDEIARRIGKTVHSIDHKARRLKLPSRSRITESRKKELDVTFQATTKNGHLCRWPFGMPKDEDFHFCDQKAILGKSYCETHCRIAYVPARSEVKFW